MSTRGLGRVESCSVASSQCSHTEADGATGSPARNDDGKDVLMKRPTTRAAKAPDRPPLGTRTGLVIVVLSLLSALATGLILTGLTPIIPTNNVVLTVLGLNLALIIAMVAVIALQIRRIVLARREAKAGSRLHIRVVSLFAVIALLPAIVLSVFATVSLNRGLDNWFSTRTKAIVQNSLAVAEAYVQEHGQVLRTDVLAMARDLDNAVSLTEITQLRLSQQAGLRDIPLAYVINDNGQVIATAVQARGIDFLAPPPPALKDATDGDPVLIAPGQSNRIAVIKQLQTFPDLYLYAQRYLDPKVIAHRERTLANVRDYEALDDRRTQVQIAFGVMYLVIALTLLLAAVWLGLRFANRLVAPIRRLIRAAQQISEGNLAVQVPIKRREGDLGQLSMTFNRMTSQLRIQRDEVTATTLKLRERRRFIETVLSGVTAGVIGLDTEGRITLANPSALTHLNAKSSDLLGRELHEAVPEFAVLLPPEGTPALTTDIQGQINLQVGQSERVLAVQVTREYAGDESYGTVVTFDDISELVAAQRTSAWSDVARRIAHEIKNPLTPIQLSAQRLKRKYGDEIETDPEVFHRCVDTIIRQVGDLKQMVDEFSDFAKMPDPVFSRTNISEIALQTADLYNSSAPDIEFTVETPDEAIMLECDGAMLGRVLNNLVKNAVEAIADAKDADDVAPDYAGAITVRLKPTVRSLQLEVIDNGIGLPKTNRTRLVEPYMTVGKKKGTGVGLAMVKRIIEQHGGRLTLQDASAPVHGRIGACIQIDVPLTQNKEGDGSTRRASKTVNQQPTEATARMKAEAVSA